jgi:hypothetical protein
VDGCDTLDGRQLDALARFDSILRRAHELTSGRGVRLVLMYIPTKFRVYRDHMVWPELSIPAHWAGNDLPQRVEAMVGAISPAMGFFDLTPAFRAAAARGEMVYLAQDTHWTPDGHRVAATALASYLTRPREPERSPESALAQPGG